MKTAQKKILVIASLAEFGERYGHYIIKSLLIFLFIEKFHYSASNSALLVGNVLGLTYASAIVGGYISDRWLNHYTTAFLGTWCMLLGNVILSLSNNQAWLFLGLGCVTLSTGLIKSNLPSFIGEVYDKTKASVGERDLGFNLFYGAIIFGALCALWIASSLKDQYGFAAPFYSSIFVSIISITTLFIGFFQLKTMIPHLKKELFSWMKAAGVITLYLGMAWFVLKNQSFSDVVFLGTFLICLIIIVQSSRHHDKKIALSVSLFFCLAIVYYTLFFQQYLSLMLFINTAVDHQFFSITFTNSQFIGIGVFCGIVMSPCLGKLWHYRDAKGKTVQDIDKFALGFLLIFLMFLILWIALLLLTPSTKLSAAALIIALIFLAFSELCFSVTGMSLITQRVPSGLVSTYMGMWFVSVGIAGKLSGLLSSCFHYTEGVEATKITTLHALLCFMGLSLLGFMVSKLTRNYLCFMKTLVDKSVV